MPSQDVALAIENYLSANWTNTPIIGLNTVGVVPGDGSPFVVVEYPIQREDQLTFGSPGANQFRESGTFRIVLNEQRSVGTSNAYAWCDTLRALFRLQIIAGATGLIQTFAPSPPVVNDANDRGDYFQVSFAVPYRYDLIENNISLLDRSGATITTRV